MDLLFKKIENEFKERCKQDKACFCRIFGYEAGCFFQIILQRFYDTGMCLKSEKDYIINVYEAATNKKNTFVLDNLNNKIPVVINPLKRLLDFFDSDCSEDANGDWYINNYYDIPGLESKGKLIIISDMLTNGYSAFRDLASLFFKI